MQYKAACSYYFYMSEIIITETRPLDCPDGLGRFVTLEKWYWKSFDWLKHHYPLLAEFALEDAWNSAKRKLEEANDDHHSVLSDQFTKALGSYIYWSMADFYPEMRGHDNDNKIAHSTTKDIFGAIIKTKGKGAEKKYRPVKKFERMWPFQLQLLFGESQRFYIYTRLVPYEFIPPTSNDNRMGVV